jgi:hypothetical protein
MNEKHKENLTVKLSADVTETTAEQIKALAQREGRTLAGMVRRLILRGLQVLTEGKAK